VPSASREALPESLAEIPIGVVGPEETKGHWCGKGLRMRGGPVFKIFFKRLFQKLFKKQSTFDRQTISGGRA